ncbi:MAG: phage portal protein [Planctomycetaceae bacterium]|nr:phage portal protein [Planctomycetaceae bacterium]
MKTGQSFLFNGNSIKTFSASTLWTAPDELKGQDIEALASTVAWLHACLQRRSDSVISVPRVIKNNTSGNVIEESDLDFDIDLMDILWRLEYSLNLYGMGYMFKERNRVRVLNVRWFDPASIEPQINPSQGLYAFKRHLGNIHILYPVDESGYCEDLAYIWLPSLREVAPGIGSAAVVETAAEVLQAIDKFSDAFFDHGAVPLRLLNIPSNTLDEERDRIEDRFKRIASGVRNAFNSVAVRSATPDTLGITVQDLGLPPADLAMDILTETKRDAILAATGVPISMVMGTAVNFATAQQEARNFIESIITPRLVIIASKLNKQLFNPAGLTLEFLPEHLPVMRRDEAIASGALVNLVNAGMPLRVAMNYLGYDPNDLPDELQAEFSTMPLFADTEPTTPPVDGSRPQSVSDDDTGDLKRWRRKARKSVKSGKTGGVRFESVSIQDAKYKDIAQALEYATTVKEVDAAFAGASFPVYKSPGYQLGFEDYP